MPFVTPDPTDYGTDIHHADHQALEAAIGTGSGVVYVAPNLTLGTANSAGAANSAIRSDATVLVFDVTVPSTQAFGDAAATGSATTAARRDHKHAMPANPAPSFATPSVALGSAAAAGAASTVIRSDSTIAAFDTTVPSTQAFADSAAIGTAAFAARRDHKHAMPADPTGKALGLTGATATTRYVGATASGAPGSGTFAVGDMVVDQTGKIFICTVAGSPGTFVQVGGSTGGVTLIEQKILGADTGPVSFTSIPNTYKDLRLVVAAATSDRVNVTDQMYLQFNTDAGANYYFQDLSGASTTPAASQTPSNANIVLGRIPAASSTAGFVGSGVVEIPAYANTNWNKSIMSKLGRDEGNPELHVVHGSWGSTAAITSIQLGVISGTKLKQNNIFNLYGIS